ncbi:conserved hypothetical protein [Bacillus mycoides]|uniref:Uncharacterized protein n=1 Tax=Bacillus mycoides TaxID=1405 RepID=A0A653TNM9_BACMY|nr:conserved hypothetical protein [Bacillus mycoides]
MEIKGVESVLYAFYFGVTANENVYRYMFSERKLRCKMLICV